MQNAEYEINEDSSDRNGSSSRSMRFGSEYEHKAQAGLSDANSPRSGTCSKGDERQFFDVLKRVARRLAVDRPGREK